MFNRTGSPAPVSPIKFDVKDAEDINCPKCSSLVGLRSQGTYKQSGKRPEIPVNGFKAKCHKCGDSFDV